MSITPKAIVIDIADVHGGAGAYIVLRSIDFLLNGTIIPMTTGFTAYATTSYAGYSPVSAFDTSLSKIDADTGGWASSAASSQRLIIVFDTPVEFDKIVINNGHSAGTLTEQGANNIVVTATDDEYTDTTYNAAITNATVLFDGVLNEHIPSNVEDGQTIWIESHEFIPLIKSAILDVKDQWGTSQGYMVIRSMDFYLKGVLVPMTTGFTAYATSTFVGYQASWLFDTSLSKTGGWSGTSWVSNYVISNQRIIIVFDTPVEFDEVVINNGHTEGTFLDLGAKNSVLTVSTDTITDTTYNAAITNATVLFDGAILPHITSDVEDNQTLWKGGSGPGSVSAKGVVVDCATNWGGAYLGIRSIWFYLDDVLVERVASEFTADASSIFSGYAAPYVWDTSKSRTGISGITSTVANASSDSRFIVTFDEEIVFNKIVINNHHNSGSSSSIVHGARAAIIRITPDTITDTTYNAEVPNSTVLFDGEIPQHVENDIIDDFIAWEGTAGSASASASASGPGPILETIRTIVNFDYGDNNQIKNIVELVYGIKLSTIVNLRYGNLSKYRKIINLEYSDLKLLKKIVNMKYGDISQLRKTIDIPYDLQYQIKRIVDLEYHIILGELRNIVDIDYSLLELDHVRNIVEILYSISSGESVEEVTSLSVINENGYVLDPYHLNVEKDEGDPCIRVEIRTNKYEDYVQNKYTDKIYVTINSDTYVVLVEESEESESISQDGSESIPDYTIKMASPCILLDSPYSDLITEELSGMASDIASYVVSKEPSFGEYGIEWNLIDWYIPAGIFSVTDSTPISILETLVSTAGGIRQSHKNGTLELRPEYPVNLPDYETETPEVYLTDQENYYSVNTVTERYNGYNNFLIGDEEVSIDSLNITYESISSYNKEARVFQVPWQGDYIELNTSATSGVTIRGQGITDLLIENEEVEIVDGEGSLEYPIYSLVSSSYSDTDLGIITPDEDKKITTEETSNTIALVSYYTKYHTFLVTNDIAENVQFWPEIK